MTEQIDTLLEEIESTEKHLAELRKEYRERKTAGLRAALQARAEAEELLRQEMKELGYGYRSPYITYRSVGSLA